MLGLSAVTEYKQNVDADLFIADDPHYGLRMTQNVFHAPAKHAWCWEAWLATEFKHTTDPLPNYPVPVWFYATTPYSGHLHVAGQSVVWIPSVGKFLSNPPHPGSPRGQQWFDSIEQIERVFNAKYVGWSEDLNGLRIIEPITEN